MLVGAAEALGSGTPGSCDGLLVLNMLLLRLVPRNLL